ncbi:MAG: DegV family protein [Acidimicrobiales bacterium]
MSGVRIVTDSACDLTRAEVEQHRVAIVPLTIRFGDREYVDVTELTPEDFYAEMARSEVLPETAAPSPGAFDATFRRLADEGASSIVCINLSGELSATGQSARSAANALEGTVDVRVVDSRSITAGLATIVLDACRAAEAGASADEIVEGCGELSERIHVFGVLDTLDNLKKGGRIGGAQALLGTMLSIKPIVDLSSGAVVEAGRQRTRRKALSWLHDKLADAGDVEQITVMHAMAPDVDEFIASLADIVNTDDLRVGTIGPVIGSHAGPRVIGLTWVARP